MVKYPKFSQLRAGYPWHLVVSAIHQLLKSDTNALKVQEDHERG